MTKPVMLKSRKLRKRKVLRVIRAASFCFGRYGHLSLFTNELHSTKKKGSGDLRYAENRKQVPPSTLLQDDFSKPLTGDEESCRNIWNMQIGIFRE